MESDARRDNLVSVDQSTGQFRPITLHDHCRAIPLTKLFHGAPEDAQSQFNFALMLGTYAWIYHPFQQITELKAFSTVGMVFRYRFPETKGFFRKRLKRAVKCVVINDHGFSHVTANEQSPIDYGAKLPWLVFQFKGDLAPRRPLETQVFHPGVIHPYDTDNMRDNEKL